MRLFDPIAAPSFMGKSDIVFMSNQLKMLRIDAISHFTQMVNL